jgi:hypothetical protein
MVAWQLLASLGLSVFAKQSNFDDRCSAEIGEAMPGVASPCRAASGGDTGFALLQHLQVRHDHQSTKEAMQRHRFPYEFVFFSHLPKVGGSSMRIALKELCRSREQKLQLCYNDLSCTSPINHYFFQADEELVPFASPRVYPDIRTWGTDQIVYGHGLRAGFERLWGLDKSERYAHVIVMREPANLLVSVWAHQTREPSLPNFGRSLNEWIERGKAEAFVDYYLSFFLDMDLKDDPWDPDVPAAFELSSGVSLLKDMPDWRDSLRNAVTNKNSIILFQDYWPSSLDRLAYFLQLSEEEKNSMLWKLNNGEKENTTPGNPEVLISKGNMARLMRAIEPLQFLYQLVRERNNLSFATPKAFMQEFPGKVTSEGHVIINMTMIE